MPAAQEHLPLWDLLVLREQMDISAAKDYRERFRLSVT
jgi:hypothetical protein